MKHSEFSLTISSKAKLPRIIQGPEAVPALLATAAPVSAQINTRTHTTPIIRGLFFNHSVKSIFSPITDKRSIRKNVYLSNIF